VHWDHKGLNPMQIYQSNLTNKVIIRGRYYKTIQWKAELMLKVASILHTTMMICKTEGSFNISSALLCTFLLTTSSDDDLIGQNIQGIFVITQLFLQ
jgi:hypothetical protein